MKKTLCYITICLLFFQCVPKPEKKQDQETTTGSLQKQPPEKQPMSQEDEVISKGEYYFEFDEVIHHQLIDHSEIDAVMKKDLNHLSKKDAITYNCYSEDYPKDLKDPSFLQELDRIGYEKTVLDTSLHKNINEIFRVKKHSIYEEASCIPEYRDILIFRKQGKLVGLAKICFTCMQNYILGTSQNTMEFGQGGDYDRLKRLLYR